MVLFSTLEHKYGFPTSCVLGMELRAAHELESPPPLSVHPNLNYVFFSF